MKQIKSLAFFTLVLIIGFATFANASTIPVNVDFSCGDGNGVRSAGGNVCPTGVGAPIPISSWQQGSINIATTPSMEWGFSSQGAGNPPPAIRTADDGPATLTITDTNGYLFDFQSLQLEADGPIGTGIDYTVTGLDGALTYFTYSGTDTVSGWYTVDYDLYDADEISQLDVTITGDNTLMYVDNVDVNEVTPEPGSLVLLGTGLLGMAFFVSRKTRNAIKSVSELPRN